MIRHLIINVTAIKLLGWVNYLIHTNTQQCIFPLTICGSHTIEEFTYYVREDACIEHIRCLLPKVTLM